MPLLLTATIPGRPRPQGSLQLSRNPRTGREFAKYGAETVLHRNLTITELRRAHNGAPIHPGPIGLHCVFNFARPKHHYGTGRNAGTLKPWAPTYMTSTPDLDKLLRLIGDALTIAEIITDDAVITAAHGEKRWAATSNTLIELYVGENLA
jgi:crossover junction endodeoxyribonuclease RusA